MKAILFSRYGSPDVLEYKEVSVPTPADDQVLIEVFAAAANPLDWHRMRADPFIVRLEDGLTAPKNPKLGADVAGRITAVGSKVNLFRVGDEVFGDIYTGSFAEYAVGAENRIALKPASVSFEQAAATPVAAVTALQGLRDSGQITAGQRVLINGASGGVGTYAVQIAKSYGAIVTAVCSTRNLELVRSIGADDVIDYTREDFTHTSKQFDLIFDAIGNRGVSDLKRALTPQGRCVVAGFTTLPRMAEHALMGKMASRKGGQTIGMMGTANPNQQDMNVVKSLLETGKIVSVIEKRYPLAQTAEAIRHLETGRTRGKLIITVKE